MCPMVNTDDLCDAHEVAALLGLTHANSVHGYLRRYDDMPRPVVALGRNRPQLWLRPEVEAWTRARLVRRPATVGTTADRPTTVERTAPGSGRR